MKKCTFFILLIFTIKLSAQVKNIYTIKADSVLLTNCDDSTELIIENHTQGIPGFLYNTGKGRTAFKRALVKLNDTTYVVGADTLKMRNSSPNAWLQGGNSFGATGKLGTKDYFNLDFYTNNQYRGRFDTLGSLLVGNVTANSGYKLDVLGMVRFYSSDVIATVGDSYPINLKSGYANGYGTGFDGSMITFGNIYASIGVNKQALGSTAAGSLLIGRTSPSKITALVDYSGNPVFVVDGSGQALINGGYAGINPTSSAANNTNSNAFNFVINGARGTGTGNVGDIIFATANAQTSGNTAHTLINRWWLKGTTGYFSNTSSPAALIDLAGATGYGQFRMRTTYTPSSSADSNGNTGDFSWDGNYFYIKTPTGWKRSALTTF